MSSSSSSGRPKKIRWIPDSEAPNCMGCSKGFGISRRRHHCRLCGHVICSSCSSKRVNLKGGSIRACDDCFASFNPAGGRRAVKAGKGSLNADGHAHSARQDTPAQTLLGAPEPSVSRIEAEQNYETYQTADDATQANPNDNARRQLYESPLAENPNKCCACCVIC